MIPKKGGSHALGLERRKGFLLQLGLARHEAYELAKATNFDVDRYEEKCQRWLSKGYPQEDVFNDILCDIRNETKNDDNFAQAQEIPSTITSGVMSLINYEDNYNFNQKIREYNDIPGIHESRSRPYETSRNDRREYYDHTSRSHSPSRNLSSIPEMIREEYRDPIRSNSRPYSPPRTYDKEELTYSSRSSRSPRRSFTTLHNDRRNEKYFSQHRDRSRSFSPSRYDRKTERSRSAERRFNARKSLNNSCEDLVTIDSDPIRNRDRKEGRYHRALSRSPIRSEGFLLNRDYSEDLVRKESPRCLSPSRNHRRYEDFPSSRSRSPNRSNFLQHDKYETTIHGRSRSRAYSPPRNDRRDLRNYQSSRSRSPIRHLECVESTSNINFQDNYRSDHKDYNTPRNQMSSSGNNKIPSLLDLDVFSSQTSNEPSQSSNIPSLLSLKINPEEIGLQPSTSKGNRHDNKFNGKQFQKDYKKPATFQNKGKFQQDQKNSNANKDLKQHIANIPVIKCGLQKPPPGHLKANPQEYWSQWWPKYKYIEYSLPKIDPNDNEIKNCVNFLFRPRENDSRRRKQVLLKRGVNAILKTIDINERNYYLRDIFKLFQYKKHLEDPSFQNSLTPDELNCIAPALRQFQIKSTMAFLHQALIVKWHVSLDIIKKVQAGEKLMSNYARLLLNEKSFHYLVKESIQELKVYVRF